MTRYRIVPEESTVHIDARSSVHPISSRTEGLDGYLDVELDGAGTVDPTAPVAGLLSFPVERLRSGNRFEDRELRRRIDAGRYPTIRGVLVGMSETGSPATYRVRGDLTFRGVTRAVEDEMTIARVDPETIRLEGQSTFDVRDFGMEPPRILMLRVEPLVAVRVDIVARREPETVHEPDEPPGR